MVMCITRVLMWFIRACMILYACAGDAGLRLRHIHLSSRFKCGLCLTFSARRRLLLVAVSAAARVRRGACVRHIGGLFLSGCEVLLVVYCLLCRWTV